jgi:hypothetical protein
VSKPVDDMGHTPKKIGLWIVCEVCEMTKRKSGWWKPCPGGKLTASMESATK